MSKLKINFRAKAQRVDGRIKVVFESLKFYKWQINKSFKDGDVLTVSVENKKSQRSKSQNNYWWGVCYPIMAEETGHTSEEIHEIMKAMFLPKKFVAVKGIEFEITKSTTKLSIGEGVEFTNKIRNFSAQELKAHIPTPCEAGFFCGRPECEVCNSKK